MQQPNTFASEQIKQDYISSLQNYALGQIEQQVSLQDKTSLKVALLSYVAVLPQYADKSFIDKSLKLNLDNANFNELLSKIITSNFKIANIAMITITSITVNTLLYLLSNISFTSVHKIITIYIYYNIFLF